MKDEWSTKVLLLGLGAQKSGTSWFANYLRHHPQVYMSPIKEMHFFKYAHKGGNWPDSYFERQLKKQERENKKLGRIKDLQDRLKMKSNPEKYKHFFLSRMGEMRFCCEITPAYSKLPVHELRKIKDTFGNVKPFIFLRNPAERLWSQLKFSNSSLSGEDLFALVNSKKNLYRYTSRSDYKSTLLNIEAVFAPSSYYCEFFENLFTTEAINGFCEFAGIEFQSGEFDKKRNTSASTPLRKHQREVLVRHLEEQYSFCADFFGGSLPECWKADLERFL